VTAVDTNILVYAHRRDSPWHERARKRVLELAESGSPWSITWPSIHEFLTVVTRQKVYSPPTPLAKAFAQVEFWFDSPSLQVIGEAAGYWEALKPLMAEGRITGPATHDARLFAICRLHGVRELWSADRDFSRFSGVRVVNPLIG
jgi:toxin-antitoxin system PIN domain toxin